MPDPTCGQCCYWFKRPPDPNNLGQVSGECRCLPPTAFPLLGPRGVQGIVLSRPNLPPDFPPCGQFREREPWQEENEEEEETAA